MAMTTCDRFRDSLLQAEPDELRGVGDSELAAHVRTCPACGRAARTLLEATAELGAYLGRAGPAPDVAGILQRAAAPAARRVAPSPTASPGVRRRIRLEDPRPWVALAAAAAIAGMLLLPGPAAPPPPTAAADPYRLPTVESASGRTVAVLPTDNPDITVLWLFQER
jgi:anti-sigma factor RsiW